MKRHLFLSLLLCVIASLPLFSQGKSPEEIKEQKEKEIYGLLDTQLDREIRLYNLEDWQVFKIDSTLVHDYMGMMDDYDALTKKGAQNGDMYLEVQDKWMESIYQSYRTVLNDEQWEKYLKSGAGKAKKSRDKREAKRNSK